MSGKPTAPPPRTHLHSTVDTALPDLSIKGDHVQRHFGGEVQFRNISCHLCETNRRYGGQPVGTHRWPRQTGDCPAEAKAPPPKS
jgi:hypothetical protein